MLLLLLLLLLRNALAARLRRLAPTAVVSNCGGGELRLPWHLHRRRRQCGRAPVPLGRLTGLQHLSWQGRVAPLLPLLLRGASTTAGLELLHRRGAQADGLRWSQLHVRPMLLPALLLRRLLLTRLPVVPVVLLLPPALQRPLGRRLRRWRAGSRLHAQPLSNLLKEPAGGEKRP